MLNPLDTHLLLKQAEGGQCRTKCVCVCARTRVCVCVCVSLALPWNFSITRFQGHSQWIRSKGGYFITLLLCQRSDSGCLTLGFPLSLGSGAGGQRGWVKWSEVCRHPGGPPPALTAVYVFKIEKSWQGFPLNQWGDSGVSTRPQRHHSAHSGLARVRLALVRACIRTWVEMHGMKMQDWKITILYLFCMALCFKKLWRCKILEICPFSCHKYVAQMFLSLF